MTSSRRRRRSRGTATAGSTSSTASSGCWTKGCRDWAASSGGASIVDFTGPDYTDSGCGPEGAIDLSQATGWGSTTGGNDAPLTNVFVPKYITVELPEAVDIDHFGVDPSATCGDGGSASTGDYKIETSPDGTTCSSSTRR